MIGDPLEVLLQVTNALNELGVAYVVVGSIASSAYGETRATMDADLVADLREPDVERFAEVLGEGFYKDVESIRDAVRRRGSFNVIHLAAMLKVDVFIPQEGGFDTQEIRRRRELTLPTDPEERAYFASPEDVVLHKLLWYERGDRVSDRQWRDAVGVIAVQGASLDADYMRSWAARLGVSELLDRAWREATA